MQYRLKKFSFTSPAFAQGGVGPAFNYFRGTPYLDMSADQFKAIGNSIGDVFQLDGPPSTMGGNSFMFVKAKAGLTEGQLVAMEPPTTGTVTNNAAQSTIYSVLTNINNAATVVTNGDVDNWIFVLATGATLCQLRRIKANTSSATARYDVSLFDQNLPSTPHDQDGFDTLATNADPCAIIRPYNVIVNTATTIPVGVALGTVTQYNYTVIQVQGLAAVSAVGNGTALVVNKQAVGGAAGIILGNANATTGDYTGAASIAPMYAYAGAGALVPCMVNFLGQ